jgi:hemerythrin
MGIIKSPDRTYSQMKMIDRCNQDMKKWIKSVKYVQYVNTATIIANTRTHFRKDGRHLTKIGYKNLERLLYSNIFKI